jgi:hypothetical protein
MNFFAQNKQHSLGKQTFAMNTAYKIGPNGGPLSVKFSGCNITFSWCQTMSGYVAQTHQYFVTCEYGTQITAAVFTRAKL